jgi:methyl acetate hydrolase
MNPTTIDGLLGQAVSDGAFPGVVAIVGDRDGVIYEGVFGRLNVDGDEPVRADTMFWIASMTKAIVSVAALGMIERGELELEQPVADVLPEFAQLPILDGFDGDEPRLRPATRTATMRHLFTHTSGLSYWFGNADVLRYHEVTGLPDPFSGSKRIFELPLLFEPGERWEYGISLDWLGRVVEAVSGQDLDTHCRERIFDPLGMPDTTFDPSDAQRARLMDVHRAAPTGPPAPEPLGLAEDQEFWSAGGGLYSTAGDYTRFLRAVLRGGELDGERVLSAESVDLAFSDQLHGAPLPPDGSVSAVPELTNDVPALPFKQGFGLGFSLLLEDIPTMRRAGSGNWAGLCNSYFFVDRTTGITLTVMTQVLPFFDARIVGALQMLEATVYAELG